MPFSVPALERSADPLDQATQTDETFLRLAKEEHARRMAASSSEVPDEDEDGTRYCLDCGTQIPTERLLIMPAAVRCVPCLSRRERIARLAGQPGGINSSET